jgi:aspartate/methionine/tyrosine aminotransferase
MMVPDISPTVQQLQPSLIRKLANIGMEREGVIPLWFGEPDIVTPDFIRNAAHAAIDAGQTFYQPNAGIPALRLALATYMNKLYKTAFAADNMIVTASGMSALAVAAQCVISHGDRIVIPSPIWPNLPSLPQILDANVVRVPLKPVDKHWTLDLDELFAACTVGTKALLINSPNNPTGWMLSDAEQQSILDMCRERGIWLVADEVYNRITYDSLYAPTFADKVTEDDLYLIVNSFSKAWAMTGWRLGWITAPKHLKSTLESLVEFNFSCIFAPIQFAGIAALEQGEAFIKSSMERYKASLNLLTQQFDEFPRVFFPKPHAAFYGFFAVEGVADSYAFAEEALLETGVGLAPGAAFGPEGEGYLRICYAKDPRILQDALERLRPMLR